LRKIGPKDQYSHILYKVDLGSKILTGSEIGVANIALMTCLIISVTNPLNFSIISGSIKTKPFLSEIDIPYKTLSFVRFGFN